MSKPVCNKASNNQNFDCPPRMSDGRVFTDYRSSCVMDDEIRMANNINSSYEYRQFLINNGYNIIESNRKYNEEQYGCKPCNKAKPVINNMITCNVDQYSSSCKVTDPNGIGVKYNTKVSNDTFNKQYGDIQPYDPVGYLSSAKTM